MPLLVVLVVLLGYLVYQKRKRANKAELNQLMNESANLSLKNVDVPSTQILQKTEPD